MLYSILIYVPEDLVDAMSSEDMDAHIAKHLRVHDELGEQGRLGPVVRLMPTTTAVQLRTTSTPHVIDGPFGYGFCGPAGIFSPLLTPPSSAHE